MRDRKRKSETGLTDKATMMQAVRSILDGGLSIKQTAIRFEIPRTTLSRYAKKCKNEDIDWQQVIIHEVPKMTPNYSVRQVFNENQEAMLADCFVKCSRLHLQEKRRTTLPQQMM